MKKLLFALSLVLGTCLAHAGPTATSATTTIELDVFGLNCSLCSDAMKKKLMQLTGARDVEPRLECGKIYLDMPAGTRFRDAGLAATLKENGFSYDGAKSTSKTVAAIRKTSPESCG